ncbi:MAG: TSUP family transporter [Rickettsiales bacterium]
MSTILIALFFSIGFFFESIFGFGGGLISYFFLSFFTDLKTMVMAGLYIGSLSSLYIAFSGRKFFDKKLFFKIMPITIIFSIFGAFIFSVANTNFLTILLGVTLLLLSIKLSFFEKYQFPKILRLKLLMLGTFIQGTFGVGGPFVVNALYDRFSSKSSLRTTMAMFFLCCNILRFIQISITSPADLKIISEIFPTIIPVFIAIYLGHLIHVKISDKYFKKGIAIITFLASLNFFAKLFY